MYTGSIISVTGWLPHADASLIKIQMVVDELPPAVAILFHWGPSIHHRGWVLDGIGFEYGGNC